MFFLSQVPFQKLIAKVIRYSRHLAHGHPIRKFSLNSVQKLVGLMRRPESECAVCVNRTPAYDESTVSRERKLVSTVSGRRRKMEHMGTRAIASTLLLIVACTAAGVDVSREGSAHTFLRHDKVAGFDSSLRLARLSANDFLRGHAL